VAGTPIRKGVVVEVGDLRRLANDSSLDDAGRARRITDRFGVYDGTIDDGRS
jgi:hypothetical protein